MTLADLEDKNLPACVPCDLEEPCLGSYIRQPDGRIKYEAGYCPFQFDTDGTGISVSEHPIVGVVFSFPLLEGEEWEGSNE